MENQTFPGQTKLATPRNHDQRFMGEGFARVLRCWTNYSKCSFCFGKLLFRTQIVGFLLFYPLDSPVNLSIIRPFKGLIRPFKGVIRLFKGLIRPLKGLIRSFKGLIRHLRLDAQTSTNRLRSPTWVVFACT